MPNRLTNLQPEPSLSADPARHRRFDVGPALGFFIVTLDALVINVALPEIGRALGGGITGLQWQEADATGSPVTWGEHVTDEEYWQVPDVTEVSR
jgi:hypothetical protein